MQQLNGILLKSDFVNQLEVDGERAWFIRDENPSTGYQWRFTPDNSGVYKEVEELDLHASPPKGMVGVPGAVAWQFEAVRPGKGTMEFQLFGPGRTTPEKTIKVPVQVH